MTVVERRGAWSEARACDRKNELGDVIIAREIRTTLTTVLLSDRVN